MQKWNPKTKVYEPYTVPAEWNTPLYSDDMDLEINCARCGRKMPYGVGYTSKQIHTDHGIGYYVCEYCYFKESAEETRYGN